MINKINDSNTPTATAQNDMDKFDDAVADYIRTNRPDSLSLTEMYDNLKAIYAQGGYSDQVTNSKLYIALSYSYAELLKEDKAMADTDPDKMALSNYLSQSLNRYCRSGFCFNVIYQNFLNDMPKWFHAGDDDYDDE